MEGSCKEKHDNLSIQNPSTRWGLKVSVKPYQIYFLPSHDLKKMLQWVAACLLVFFSRESAQRSAKSFLICNKDVFVCLCVWSASSDWLPLASHPHFICVSTDFTYSSTFSHTPWKQTNRQTYTTSNSRRSVSLLYTSGYNYNIAIVDGSMGDRKPNNHNENTMKCPEHNKLNRKRMRQRADKTPQRTTYSKQ